MLARRVDALIIASTQWTVESFRRIEERKRPYVLIDRCFAGPAGEFRRGGRRSRGTHGDEHLISVGCRRIAHIRGSEISPALGV